MTGIQAEDQNERIKRQYPQVLFSLNQALDAQTAFTTLDYSKNGIDYGAPIVLGHPKLIEARGKDSVEKKSIIDRYVADYYSQHLPKLEEDRVNFQRVWDEVQPAFFETSRTVFEGYELKPDNYTAFVSIFNCGQRFLDSKSFQTYRTHPAGIIHQVAHEMLHFIFYDWIKKDPKYIDRIGTDNTWILSEVFDDLVFEQNEFTRFKSKKEGSDNPELASIAETIKQKIGKEPFSITSFMQAARTIF